MGLEPNGCGYYWVFDDVDMYEWCILYYDGTGEYKSCTFLWDTKNEWISIWDVEEQTGSARDEWVRIEEPHRNA
jgi:hypothetical protein